MRISDWSSDVCSSDLLEACCTAAFTHTQVKIFTCCDAIFIYHCGPPLLLTCWRMCCERARHRIRTGCSELLEKSGRMSYRKAARCRASADFGERSGARGAGNECVITCSFSEAPAH